MCMLLSKLFLEILWGGWENVPPDDKRKVEKQEVELSKVINHLEEEYDILQTGLQRTKTKK